MAREMPNNLPRMFPRAAAEFYSPLELLVRLRTRKMINREMREIGEKKESFDSLVLISRVLRISRLKQFARERRIDYK
jgi:hypothetical protein